MNQDKLDRAKTPPAPLKHTAEARSDADLAKELRLHAAAQPAVRFCADLLAAMHAPGGLRDARAFHASFAPAEVLQALAERPDLRARLGHALTGGAPTLLRRLGHAELAGQIELLITEDLPAAERVVRAEEDRAASALELYRKYLEPVELAAYLPAGKLWQYESADSWWQREGAAQRALMVAEIKSVRRNAILTDTEILDLLGDEVIERDLPLGVRTALRAAARKAAREGKPFRDSDLFAGPPGDGKRDLVDELGEHVALPLLRKVVDRAAEVLALNAPIERPIDKPVEKTPAPVLATGGTGGRLPMPLSKPAPVAAKATAKSTEPARKPVAPDRALTPFGGNVIPAVDVSVADAHPEFADFAADLHKGFADVLDPDAVISIDDTNS